MFVLQTPDPKFDSVIHFAVMSFNWCEKRTYLLLQLCISVDQKSHRKHLPVVVVRADPRGGAPTVNVKVTLEKCYAKGGGQEGQGPKLKNQQTF